MFLDEKERYMKKIACLVIAGLSVWIPNITLAAEVPVSDATSECLECHSTVHPGYCGELAEKPARSSDVPNGNGGEGSGA